MGASVTPAQLQVVREHARQHRGLVTVVTPVWLQLCLAHRRCIEPDASCTYSALQLGPVGGTAVGGGAAPPAPLLRYPQGR